MDRVWVTYTVEAEHVRQMKKSPVLFFQIYYSLIAVKICVFYLFFSKNDFAHVHVQFLGMGYWVENKSMGYWVEGGKNSYGYGGNLKVFNMIVLSVLNMIKAK